MMGAWPAEGPRAASRSPTLSGAAGPPDGLEAAEREPFLRAAAALKRPRHLILLETARDQVRDQDAAALNELRRALDAGELGAEGFQTALRLGGGSASEVKRILFRPPPR